MPRWGWCAASGKRAMRLFGDNRIGSNPPAAALQAWHSTAIQPFSLKMQLTGDGFWPSVALEKQQ